MKKKIAILGASGSIGTQTIEIIRENPDLFELVSFAVGKNIEFANQVINEFDTIKYVSVQNQEDVEKIDFTEVGFGIKGMTTCACFEAVDIVITAVVGSVGLEPTIAAIKAKKDIGLANKETLVVAGHLIMPLVKEYGVSLLPVDSEHSAIFQSLNPSQAVNKIILTASGGSFRDKPVEELASVTLKDALNHPNWSMGNKITIDSATMFNKGLEVIEAHFLFDIDYDDIEVLIHRQSIVHSMVEYVDFGVIAQLGTPDMKLPIQYALTYPNRNEIKNTNRLDLSKLRTLDFEKPDFCKYPALELAYIAGKAGASMPTVLNAANEAAVGLFLDEKISYLQIAKIVRAQMQKHKLVDNPSLEEILKIDQEVRLDVIKESENLC